MPAFKYTATPVKLTSLIGPAGPDRFTASDYRSRFLLQAPLQLSTLFADLVGTIISIEQIIERCADRYSHVSSKYWKGELTILGCVDKVCGRHVPVDLCARLVQRASACTPVWSVRVFSAGSLGWDAMHVRDESVSGALKRDTEFPGVE